MKIKVPHPNYPATRISVQVPNLGVHFSPSRYRRIMELLNIFVGTMETCSLPSGDNSQDDHTRWNSADLTSDAKILVWGVGHQSLGKLEIITICILIFLFLFLIQGIGNSVATWQPCFLVLSELYLYVLESERSPTYQRYSRLATS